MYSDRPVNVRLTLAYDGTRWAGWQRQPNAPTVQEALETALARLTGEAVSTHAAGRTDAGVHARGQVVSFRLEREFPPAGLVHGGNRHLPADIRVVAAAAVGTDFHARRSAISKRYAYRLWREGVVPPDVAPFVVPAPERFDLTAAAAATRALPGRHDFAAFALTGGAATTSTRRMFAAGWTASEEEYVFEIVGEGFLRGMVRRLVGTLLDIGRGARPPGDLAALLADPARGSAGPTAAARGLVLRAVEYPAAAAGAAVDSPDHG